MHNRLKDFFRELHPMICERFKEAAPAFAIGTQSVLRILQIALQHDGGAIVQRMRERSRRVNPFQAILLKWERRKKWRANAHRVNRRAKVMLKPGKRERKCARPTADFSLCFVYFDAVAGLRED